jgi:hypothetical protein
MGREGINAKWSISNGQLAMKGKQQEMEKRVRDAEVHRQGCLWHQEMGKGRYLRLRTINSFASLARISRQSLYL